MNYSKNESDFSKIKDYIKNTFQLTPGAFSNCVKEYQNLFSDDDKELLYDLAFDYKRYSNSYMLKLRDLLSLENETDKFNYLMAINCLPHELKNAIMSAKYQKYLSSDDIKVLEQFCEVFTRVMKPIISERIGQGVIEARSRMKREYCEEMLPYARKIIGDYINTDAISIEKFCNQQGIKSEEFYRLLEVLNFLDDPIYEEYKSFASKQRSSRYATILENGKKMCDLLVSGVQLPDGNTRAFDIIDYNNLTKLDFNDFFGIVKSNLSPAEIRSFRNFVSANSNFQHLNLDNLYNSKQIFGVQFDSKGNIIPNTGRVIEKEEKENLVNYLKENHLPLVQCYYNAVFKRWKEGNLLMPTSFSKNDEDQSKRI